MVIILKDVGCLLSRCWAQIGEWPANHISHYRLQDAAIQWHPHGGFWNLTCSAAQDPNDPFEHEAIIRARTPSATFRLGQKRFYLCPLFIRDLDFRPGHCELLFANGNSRPQAYESRQFMCEGVLKRVLELELTKPECTLSARFEYRGYILQGTSGL
jgi:hypothetical protein